MNNIYQWNGVDPQGQRAHGKETANNAKELREILKNRGMAIFKIKKTTFFNLRRPKKISEKQLSELTAQIALLLQSNVDLINALQMMIQEADNSTLKTIVITIKKNIENGMSFSQSLNQFPQHFDKIYCGLIHAGEQSGTLGQMMKQLADYQEKMLSLRAKIKKSLFYPTTVAIVALLVTVGLLIFIVPQFENIFNNFGAKLPLFTQAVLKISHILQVHAKKMLLFLLAGFVSYRYFTRRYARFSAWVDQAVLRLPVVGELLLMAIFCRWTRVLATLLTAELSLVAALRIAKKTVSNRSIQTAMSAVIQQVSAGSLFYQALSAHSCFSRRIIQMIAVGENAGQLAVMLEKIADNQQAALDNRVDYFSKWLEPAIMIILAVITGSLIIAMYLPVFQLGAVM